jgi:hypothetical protein
MSLPNQLIVSGAGTAAVNGTYTRGADQNGQQVWSRLSDNTIIKRSTIIGPPGFWSILDVDTSTTYYNSPSYFPSSSTPEDPANVAWTSETGQTPPTVTAAAAAPSTVTFPSSPTLNQSFTAGTRTWVFNGTAWKLQPKTTDQITEGSTNLYYTDARVASAPAVTALETRAGTIESAASTLAGRVTTAEGSITTLTSGLATEKGRVDAILDASQADKDSFAEIVQLINSVDTENDTAFGTYVTNNNASVAAIDTRLTTAEGEIDTLQSDLDAAESAASTLTGRVSTAESDIDALEGRATTAESDIDALESRATSIESAASSLTTRVGTAESDIDSIETAATALTTRVTTAESDIDSLETGKQIKDVISATAPSHVAGLRWIDTTDMSQYVSFGGAWVELDKA